MRLSRTVLIALAAAAGLLVVAAVAGPALVDRMGGRSNDGDRITIAIATSETLEAFYRRAERNVEEANRQADEGIEQVSSARNAQADTADDAAKPPGEGANNSGERVEATENRDMIEALIVTALDELGSELTEEMSQNERFAVTEPSALLGALRDLRDRRETRSVPLLQRLMFWREQRTTPNGEDESAHLVVSSATEGADLASAGDQLNVRYILFVALAPDGLIPTFSNDPNDSGAGWQMTVEPRVIYRVFDVRTQTVVLAGLEPLRPPVSVPYTAGNSASARQQLVNSMNERIARIVTRKLTDALAPARLIESDGDLIVNRGAIDGIRENDTFPVEREGEVVRDAVADGGAGGSLGRRRSASGQVQVVSVQDSYAVVRIVDGEPKAQDVVVLDRRTRGASQTAANGGSGGAVPLGARAIREQQRGARPRAAIAVGRINVELLEPQNWRRPNSFASDLSRRVGDGLTQDRRITIVSRMDMSRIQDERGVAAASRGDYDADLAEGIATADYQVIGEVRLTSRNVGQTVSVGGQSRETNVRPRLFAEGTFRILDVDGRQIDSVPIRVERAGGAMDAGAVNELMNEVGQVASAQILIALFPIEVASVSGDRIVLTRGSEAGLRVGARLRVYRIGEPVRDQYTEDVISEGARTHLGDLVVVDAPEGAATARFAARSFGLQQNDLVEISTSQTPAASTTPRAAQSQQQQQDPTGGVRF